MVSFTKNDNGYAVEFTSNPLYLKNGKINFPVNALSMVIDKSNTATFKRTSTNDVAFSAKISDIQFDGTQATKANIETLFAQTCTGANGGSADEEMIPVSVALTGTTMAFYNEDNELLFSADTSAYLADKYVKQAYTSGTTLYLVIDTETGDTTVQVDLNAVLLDYYTREEIDNAEMAIVSAITQCDSRLDFLEDEVEDFAYESDLDTLEAEFTAFYGQVENAEEATAAALNDLNERKLDASAYTSSDLSNYYNKAQVDTKLAGKADIVRLTQQQYDALSGDTNPNTIYVITDAYPVDMQNYYTKSQTNSLLNNYYTKSEVDEAIADIDLSEYYTKSETDTLLNAKVSTTTFEATEQATSAALNDLNSRIGDIGRALEAINGV